MFLDGLVIGGLIGKIRGGEFKELLNINLRAVWLIVLAFSIQFAVIFFYPDFLWLAIPLTYGILLLFSYLNRHQPGFCLIMAGIAMNLLVMVANGGRMPVDVEYAKRFAPEDVPALVAGEYGKHIGMSELTKLNLLGDIFYLHAPYPHETLVSLGDIVFSIGVFIFIQKIMVRRRPPIQGSVFNGIR